MYIDIVKLVGRRVWWLNKKRERGGILGIFTATAGYQEQIMLGREFSGSGAHSKCRAFGQCLLGIGLKALIEPREEIRKLALDIFLQHFGWVEVKFED